MRKWIVFTAGIALVAVFFGIALWDKGGDDRAQSNLVAVAAAPDLSGFARATGPKIWQFPQDFGPHPNFQTEWWYYTGNLEASSGEHFGYQLTFFRRALLPPQELPRRSSDWATAQIYMAHFALTDVSAKQYKAYERLERGAAGLAGAQSEPFQVWLDNWQVEQVKPGSYHLDAQEGDVSVDLNLEETLGPILQGDQGYSRKGPEPGQASYYYSLVHLKTQGEIYSSGRTYQVNGLSWMDHEFSTSALGKNQVGWDWFALQLDDGSALMVYQIRQTDGSAGPFSSGSWITPDGRKINLSQSDFSIQVHDTWTSPKSGARYPSAWTIQVPKAGLQMEVKPYLANQELNVSYSYWEGAVQVVGRREGQPVSGSGYVELTGYSASMSGEF